MARLPQRGHDLGAVSGVAGARVSGVGGVADPVHRFDAPLAAGDAGEVGGAGPFPVQAGDGVHDFLADQGAVDVVAVAADPGDPGDVREVDALGAGDPEGAPGDPAVAVVQLGVVGLARAVLLDGAEDGFLERGLVALDDYLQPQLMCL
jgi:hypothetical protein